MVAYSFKKVFVRQIETGRKRQTIRADRKRHARPGEPVQIYTGMRTRHCRKIIEDPICESVTPIRIVVPEDSVSDWPFVDMDEFGIELGGELLGSMQVFGLAMADGFGGLVCHHEDGRVFGMAHHRCVTDVASPAALMAAFWRETYGPGVFSGVLIRWRPA